MKSIFLFLALFFAVSSVPAQVAVPAGLSQLPGTAKDIDIGADGSIWRVGTDSSIARFEDGGWTKIDGTASRIAVDNFGFPWVIKSTGEILRRNGRKWIVLSGTAIDIDIGSNGDVWVVGKDGWIRRWGGEDWVDAIKADATRIAVDGQGMAWILNSKGEVSSADGATKFPGTAKSVAIGSDALFWIVDLSLSVSKLTSESKWREEIKGFFAEITIDSGGSPILVDSKGNVFRASPDKLEPPSVFPARNDDSGCESIVRQRFAAFADTPAKIADLGALGMADEENGVVSLCSGTADFTKTATCFVTNLSDYRDTYRAVNECRVTPVPEKPRSIIFNNTASSRTRIDLTFWIYEKGQLIRKTSANNVAPGGSSTLTFPRYLARTKNVDLTITPVGKPIFRTNLPFDFVGAKCFNPTGPC